MYKLNECQCIIIIGLIVIAIYVVFTPRRVSSLSPLVLCHLGIFLNGGFNEHHIHTNPQRGLVFLFIHVDAIHILCVIFTGRFPNLENDVEEGICQVIAHMWLKSELKKGYAGSSINKRLGEFFIHQIEMDSSPIYGHGFRAASRAVAQYGLSQRIQNLRQTNWQIPMLD